MPDLDRLKQLLSRLRELETRTPAPHEGSIVEVGRLALREEVTRLAHAIHDNSYWQQGAAQERHAG